MKFLQDNILKLTVEEKAEADKILRASAHMDKNIAMEAMRLLAARIETPIRQGIMSANNLNGIFTVIPLEYGSTLEMPLHFLQPGTEKDFNAYAIPNAGRIPEKAIEGDYVMIPTYAIGGAIDWLEKFSLQARWDVMSDGLELLQAMMVKKMNDDGWHTILAAAVDRNVVVYDSDAANGLFTKRLVQLMKTTMRRNGGGNAGSLNRFKLTHIALSPEALEDMRSWGVDQVDEITRREIYTAADGTFSRVFGVNLIDLDEFGEGQEYQNYLVNELGAALVGSDTEFCVGLDLSKSNTFIMAQQRPVTVYEADDLKRQFRQGFYARADLGFGVMDNRALLLGSM